MITSLKWIPRGVTPRFLQKAETNIELVDQYLSVVSGDAHTKPEEPHPISEEDAAIIKKYGLDTYDDDDKEDEKAEPEYITDDPFLVSHPEEEDENAILKTDYLLMVGKSTEPDSSLEVHIFDDNEKAFYPHHEIMLPSFPLSIAWMDASPGTPSEAGSFCAISTMLPHIEIWNLNIAECTIPCAWLQHHTDSVTSLSWNPLQPRALLSASVDGTAAIWHLDQLRPAAVFNLGQPRDAGTPYANGKACEWNPKQESIFGVGTSEGIYCYDARSGPIYSSIEGESIDTFAWLNDQNLYIASTENGNLFLFDSRNPANILQEITGHTNAVSSISVSRYQPRQIIASTDLAGDCIIWDLSSGQAVMNQVEHMGMKQLFSSQFCPDKPLLLAVGGSTSETRIWDVEEDLDKEINPDQPVEQ